MACWRLTILKGDAANDVQSNKRARLSMLKRAANTILPLQHEIRTKEDLEAVSIYLVCCLNPTLVTQVFFRSPLSHEAVKQLAGVRFFYLHFLDSTDPLGSSVLLYPPHKEARLSRSSVLCLEWGPSCHTIA